MKKLALLFAIIVSTAAFSQETAKKVAPPEGKALIGDSYGAKLSEKSEKKAITTAKLEKKLRKAKKLKTLPSKEK